MSYVLKFTANALEDIEKHKKAGDQATLKKLQRLLNELRVHPAKGTGKPERLKHELEGLYSRRINRKHRLVYSIDESVVLVCILSAYDHYGDK
ncbi:MAG: Txe/YoeB family addiction module toxin [Cyclobacteriaceae bacterium]